MTKFEQNIFSSSISINLAAQDEFPTCSTLITPLSQQTPDITHHFSHQCVVHLTKQTIHIHYIFINICGLRHFKDAFMLHCTGTHTHRIFTWFDVINCGLYGKMVRNLFSAYCKYLLCCRKCIDDVK